jgi:NAD(P)H-dependent FMN reductase
MEKLKVKVILGSTRQNRFSDKPGKWILDHAAKRPDMDVELLDLRDYPMPFFDEPVSTSSKKEPFKNEMVAKWAAKIAEGDAFVIIAPEYNHSMPAVLKNALDYVYQEWNNKPVGFVAYGSAMGARSVEQLRLVAVELQLAPIRNAVHVPVDVLIKAAGWSGPADPSALAALDEKAKGLLDQLAWWGQALKVARNKS